jgi:hypothetical protein
MIVKVEAYSPEGFKVCFEANVHNMKEARKFTQVAAQSGFTPEPPEAGATETETITSVIRREKINDDGTVTPIIDMYPNWRGEYGQYRFVGVYLNSDEDVRQFEHHSGLKVQDLPLFDSQTPWKRHPQRPKSQEVKCKPFIAIKRFTGEEKEIEGKLQKVYRLIGYEEIAPPADPEPDPQRPASSPPASGQPKPTLMPQPLRGQRLPLSTPPRPAAPPSAAHPGAPLASTHR